MQKNNSVHEILEKIKSRLESEDLTGLNIPPYAGISIPKNLPDTPGFSSYRDTFFQILDKIMLLRYKNISIKTDKKLIFFTWVIPSGLGDLGMQIHVAETIAEMNKDLKIELVTLIDERSPLPDSLRSKLPHHIIMYKHPEPALLTPKVQKLLREAFCIIDIPTDYFDFPAVKALIEKNNTAPPILSRIGQYGFLDTKSYNPTSQNRCMGLHPLEKGILSLPLVSSQKRNPDQYFAYLITKEGITTYFLSVLIHRQKDQKDLKLIVPNLGKILPLLKEIDFKSYGIKEILIKDAPEKSSVKIQAKGKTLTIEHKKNINPKIIVDLMSTSNSFVGIRGDGSFTECITTDSIFFYDALDHALPFLMDLCEVAKKELFAYFSLGEYLPLLYQKKLVPIKRARKIAELLDDPSFIQGMERLRSILHEKHCLNHNLMNLIKKNFALYKDPSLLQKEEKLFEKFIEKKISFKTLIDFIF